MAVDSLTFQRDPKGAEVALFKHVGANACGRGLVDRWAVHGTPVAEQHLVGNAVALP